jgi:hypothetical protein
MDPDHKWTEERCRRSLKRRLDNARLGSFKPIADFDWSWPQNCDRSLVEELFSFAFVEEAPTSS